MQVHGVAGSTPPSLSVHNAHAAAVSELPPLTCIYIHTYAPETSAQPRRKDMSLSATCAAKYVRLNNKSLDSYPCQRRRLDCHG